MSGDAYNDNKCACTEYDELMQASMVETDTTKRFEMMHEAEKILVDDYAWAVPVLSTQTVQLMNTNITNRIVDPSRNSIRTKYLDIE